MPLNNLNKELYKSSSETDRENVGQINPDPFYRSQETNNPFIAQESWVKEEKGFTQKQKRLIGIVSGILAGLIILGGGIAYFISARKNAFQEDRVLISFDGPKEADSTQPVSYLIKYQNNNSVKLKDAELLLNYSENFQPSLEGNVNLKQLNSSNSKIYIGDIKAKSDGEVRIGGIFYAPKDSPVYLRGTLKYTPSNISSQFESKNQIGVNITTSPIFLEVTAPVEISTGDEVVYVIDYKNLDVKPLSDAQLLVTYPEGFEFSSSEPSPSQGKSVWYFGMLENEKGGKVTVRGRMNYAIGDASKIKVQLGRNGGDGNLVVYNEREKTTRIVESPFVLEQTLEENPGLVASQGDVLKYRINYKNRSAAILQNAILTFEINGDAINYPDLYTSNGYFDSKTKTITWKASEIPAFAALSPGAEGSVNILIPILKQIPVKKEADGNFVIRSVAKINSSNYVDQGGQSKTITSNELKVKINSRASFQVLGYRSDSKITNAGSMPMTVGKETDFAIHWVISSDTNSLNDAKVISSLPSGVKWTGMVYPSGENITYNERTNEVIWNIGSIPAGAGSYKSKKEVVFQVRVIPQPTDVDKALKLLNNSVLTAKDSFTNTDVRIENKDKNTELEEDPSLGYDYFKVKGL